MIWTLAGEIKRTLAGHSSNVRCVAVNNTGTQALSGAEDGSLILWDLNTGQIVHRLPGHQSAVLCVDISLVEDVSHSPYLGMSGAEDGSVSVWDLTTGTRLYHWPGYSKALLDTGPHQKRHFDAVWDVAFAPDGRTALSVSEDEAALLWDLDTGESRQCFTWDQTGLFSVMFSDNGTYALMGTLDGQVVRLEFAREMEILRLLGHTGRVTALTLGKAPHTVFSASADGTIRYWDLRNGAEMRRLDYAPALPATLDLSPSADLALTGFWDGTLEVWDYASGTSQCQMHGHTEALFAGAYFTPSGDSVLSGAGDIFGLSEDATLRLWDISAALNAGATTGKEQRRFTAHTQSLYAVALSPDGLHAASVSKDGTLRYWQLDQGTHTVFMNVWPQSTRSVAFSPDGKSVLVGLAKGHSHTPDYAVRLLDVTSGQELQRFVGHNEAVTSIAFSPDGKMVATGGYGKAIILWDVASATKLNRLVGHTGACMCLLFSNDGRWLLSSSSDQTVMLWDVARGTAIRRFRGHYDQVLRTVFGPDERTVLSASVDGTVREWRIDATQEDLLAWIAANRYVADLTPAQRAKYQLVQG
jgi:WD40 repeat protein